MLRADCGACHVGQGKHALFIHVLLLTWTLTQAHVTQVWRVGDCHLIILAAMHGCRGCLDLEKLLVGGSGQEIRLRLRRCCISDVINGGLHGLELYHDVP